MSKNNCAISRDDIFLLSVYDAKETKQIFGKEYLEEYGTYIPEELIKEYQENWEKLQKIQSELYKYYEK